MKLIPKLPKNTTDQIMLVLSLILFGCTSTMISLVVQEKPIPSDFKDFAQHIATGIFAGLTFNEITK